MHGIDSIIWSLCRLVGDVLTFAGLVGFLGLTVHSINTLLDKAEED